VRNEKILQREKEERNIVQRTKGKKVTLDW
jgi:hypothetical protein